MKPQTPAVRRYLRRFFPTMIAYVVVLFTAVHLIDAYKPKGAALVVLAALPALPIIGVLIVIGAYLIEEKDEFLRQRIVTAMMFGMAIVLSASTVLGFLQIGGVIDHVDVFWGFPLWCAAWGFAQGVMAFRDRMAGAGE